MVKRKASWLEVAVQRTGFRNASRALSWAYTWAVVREALDHEPSAEEVAKWWNASDRTTYREQAAFRKAFPELPDPGALYATPEARAAIARHADFGDKLDRWKAERRADREVGMVRIGLGPASLPSTQ